MSSSDRGRPTRRRAAGILFAVAATSLAACTVGPLYGPVSGGGQVQGTMRSIEIAPVDDRVAQVVRNEVLFELTGGAATVDPRYRMKLTVTNREKGLGLTHIDSSPVYSVQVTATYEVTEIATGKEVLRGTSEASATYNRVNQGFANTRAKLDAEDRAAETVAGEIAIKVAAAAATTL